MATGIGTRIILGVALATALVIGSTGWLSLRAQRADLIAEVNRGADQLSSAIKGATHYNMLENRRDSLHRQIEEIGRQPGIDTVRVFNKEGVIVFSSDAAEIGQAVDKRAEACTACHAEGQPLQKLPGTAERSRIFGAPGGGRRLGIINPIANEPSCTAGACHAHGPGDTILGVLDVTLSLDDVDRRLAGSQRRLAALFGLAIGGASLAIWLLNRRLVVQPVRALAGATRRVAQGDLGVVIEAGASHELGQLARAFNHMVQSIADARRQLTQADKLASVGRLAAGVAHEINNPLTGVLSHASCLCNRADEGSETRRDLEVIVHETKRCREIVRGLLDFARQTPPDRHPTDLTAVARRAAALTGSQMAAAGAVFELELAARLPLVLADANQLQQVLVNLLVNAADAVAAAGGGRVRLATRHAGDSIELTVEDSGTGIDPADLPHLFEPFFTTKGPRGTGLGLAVSWGIVEAHGGKIEVESRPGQGSRFTVRLPAGGMC